MTRELAEERVYEWEVARIGDSAPPYVFEVTAENIAGFCRAARYENPAYTVDAAARDSGLPGLVAPPAMVFTYAPLRLADLMAAQGYVRPASSAREPRPTPIVDSAVDFQGVLVAPQDVVTSVTSVHGKHQRGNRFFVTFRVVGHNQRGEVVADYRCTCLWRKK